MGSHDVILAFIKVLVLVWDFITYPIYQASHSVHNLACLLCS